ncbi:hypothetical protein Tco_1565392 [Tanacetum coccineum]
MKTRILSVLLEIAPNLARREQCGKERACVYFNFPFEIKLATGLNVFQQDPSPHGRIVLLVSLLNSFHWEGLKNSAMIS